MNRLLEEQLAIDYCCTPAQVRDNSSHFCVYEPLEGRRRWREGSACLLKIACVNGKQLFAGSAPVLEACREKYGEEGNPWFFEASNLRALDTLLAPFGGQVAMAHPFFVSDTPQETGSGGFDIRWYEEEEIGAFRGDDRFREAFSFEPDAPDMLGVCAMQGGEILGMAGASADSERLWQIGIDVVPEARGRGIGVLLVRLLRNRILETGRLPFYGTGMSHIASQRVALAAGFVPAWAELSTEEKK